MGEAPFVIRFEAPPGSSAYSQGLRNGDLLDLRLLTPGDRYRWVNYFHVVHLAQSALLVAIRTMSGDIKTLVAKIDDLSKRPA